MSADELAAGHGRQALELGRGVMHLGYVEFVVDSGNYNGAPLALAGGLGGVDLATFKFPKDGVEIPAQARGYLKQYDTNGDGRIDEKEFEAMPQSIKRIIAAYVQRTMP